MHDGSVLFLFPEDLLDRFKENIPEKLRWDSFSCSAHEISDHDIVIFNCPGRTEIIKNRHGRTGRVNRHDNTIGPNRDR